MEQEIFSLLIAVGYQLLPFADSGPIKLMGLQITNIWIYAKGVSVVIICSYSFRMFISPICNKTTALGNQRMICVKYIGAKTYIKMKNSTHNTQQCTKTSK